MDEIIVSNHSSIFYYRTFGVMLVFIPATSLRFFNMIINTLHGHLLVQVLAAITCMAVLFVYPFFMLKNIQTITVSKDQVCTKFFFSGKKVTVNYPDIKHMGTYSFGGSGNSQSLVLKFGVDGRIQISANDYSNYDRLKSFIYKYKLRPEDE